jgi:Leucine-rich repeat
MAIGSITDEEKNYLTKFTALACLALNQNELVTLANLPECRLVKLELNDNELTGAELKHLMKYSGTLQKLKLSHNKITSFDDLEFLAAFRHLKSLELQGNPVSKLSDFKVRIFRLLPSLEVLDRKNRVGEAVFSDSDEDDYGDELLAEGGEDEMVDFDDRGLTEEQIEELKKQGISMDDF